MTPEQSIPLLSQAIGLAAQARALVACVKTLPQPIKATPDGRISITTLYNDKAANAEGFLADALDLLQEALRWAARAETAQAMDPEGGPTSG